MPEDLTTDADERVSTNPTKDAHHGVPNAPERSAVPPKPMEPYERDEAAHEASNENDDTQGS